jgi:hypothetical protein
MNQSDQVKPVGQARPVHQCRLRSCGGDINQPGNLAGLCVI